MSERHYIRGSLEKRFWAKVVKTDHCWEWTAAKRGNGYGVIKGEGPAHRLKAAHRLAYEWTKGPIPDGMFVDHICHNKACVNPEHLRLATNKQNAENLQGPRGSNPSGFRGVALDARSGKWYVRVKHNYRVHYGGEYSTAEEAGEAARQLRLKLYTHNDADHKQAT